MTEEKNDNWTSVDDRTMLWGRVGKIFAADGAPATAEDAIVEAGLDWSLDLRKIGFHNSGGNFVVAQGKKAVVREDTDTLLGVVGGRYKTFDNREAFSFADSLVDGAGAAFESAFSYEDGKVVGLTMRLPEHIEVAGGDSFGQYLMLRTRHDGTGSIQVAVQNVRMMCLNQFDFKLRQAKNRWAISHTQRASQHLQQAREALKLTFAYTEEWAQAVDQLTTINYSDAKLKDELERILTRWRIGSSAIEDQVASVLGNRERSSTIQDEVRGTAYGALNAATEYYEHLRPYRTNQSRYLNNVQGLAFRVRNDLSEALLANA